MIADGSGNGPTLASGDQFGRSVASIGDINNDGINDIAVGAPGENSGGTDKGAVYICFMDTDGTVKTSPAPVKITQGSSVTTPAGTFNLSNSDFFGCSVAGIGDLDGDGYEDIAVGAYGTTIQGNTTGAVYILFLNSSADILSYKQITYGSPGFVNLPANCQFGFSLANAGDLNNDGKTDIIVGAPAADTGNGTVWLIRLKANGQVKSYMQIKENTNGFDNNTTTAGDNFGYSVTGAGDLNADGIPDVIVGVPGEDDGYTNAGGFWILYLDTTSAVLDEKELSYPLMENHYYPDVSSVSLGESVSVTDINNDGITDIIAGVKTFNGSKGGFYFMVLDDEQNIQAIKMTGFSYGWDYAGPSTAPQLGVSLCEIALDGDLEHKQYLVGANFHDPSGSTQEGSVYIITMNPLSFDFPAGRVVNFTAITDYSGDFTATLANSDIFGADIAVIGDVNNDGVDDIVVGANGDNTGFSDAGAAYVLLMKADGRVDSYKKIAHGLNNFPTTFLGTSDQFGWGVGPAGDFNGDGIEDVLIAAPTDDDGGIDAGAVYIVYLNIDGSVKTSPAPTKIVHPDNIAGDRFGIDVDTIGDLDNDGVRDLVVGASQNDDGGTDRGAVYILFMNSNGTVKAKQRISDTQGGFSETFANNNLFGISVDGIGDFNGDGNEDILVGSANHNGTGAAFIIYLNTNGTVAGYKKINNANGNFPYTLRSGNFFGNSVQMIPDIDGNGVRDVMIVQPVYSTYGIPRGAIWITRLDSLANVLDAYLVTDSCGGLYINMHNNYFFGGCVRYYGTDTLGNVKVISGIRDDGGATDRGGILVLSLVTHLSPLFKLPNQYVVLKREHDAGVYNPLSSYLQFEFDEEYNLTDNALTYAVYDRTRSVVLSSSTLPGKTGDNRKSIFIGSLPSGYYTLEVQNQKNEIFKLRFKK